MVIRNPIIKGVSNMTKDIDRIVKNLKVANEPIEELEQKEQEIIHNEVELLLKFIKKIYPYTSKKMINGNECILIFVYQNSLNDTISNEVYLDRKGVVLYQVYDEDSYRGIVPDAKIEDGFSFVRIDHFLQNKSLKDIIEFFEDRPSKLKNKEFNLRSKLEQRMKFNNEFEDLL